MKIFCDESYFCAVINGESFEFHSNSDMKAFIRFYRSEKGVINSLSMYKVKIYNLLNSKK